VKALAVMRDRRFAQPAERMFRGFEVSAAQFDTKKRTDMIKRGRAGRRAERSPDLVQIVYRDAQPGRASRSVRDRKPCGRR
jgi:hypothetical protein